MTERRAVSEGAMTDPRSIRSVDWQDGNVLVIDQRALPGSLETLVCANASDLVDAIRSLAVRGAPAIGIAGAFGIAMVAHRASTLGVSGPELLEVIATDAQAIREARPTAVNLSWAVDRVLARLAEGVTAGATSRELSGLALLEAHAIRDEDASACLAMAKLAQTFIRPGARILTHCNTGLLCTGGIGTALGALRVAHEDGLAIEVITCETRPLLQGARLTAWELGLLGIPHRLIVDGAAAGLIMRGGIDAVFVGADRIAANGDTANKVGTLAHGLAAKARGIPFVVIAPESTIDRSLATGASIEIEERDPREVTELLAVPGTRSAWNPAFDITPAEFISAIVSEDGIWIP